MKKNLCFLVLACSLLCGCYRDLRFYPVQGPRSILAPAPVFIARFSGGLNSGTVTLTLNGGEKVKGPWAQVRRPVTKNVPAASEASSSAMISVWDTIYGQGFYVAHVLGTPQFARARLTGDKGTTVELELYIPPEKGNPDIKGVAKDNQENIYKVTQ